MMECCGNNAACGSTACDEYMIEEQRLTGPDRVREAIARDRGEYEHAPNWPVQLCGPEAGILYLPEHLLPETPEARAQFLADFARQTRMRVEVVYRADSTPPLPRVNRLRRLGNRLVAPVAKLLGF